MSKKKILKIILNVYWKFQVCRLFVVFNYNEKLKFALWKTGVA